MNPGQNLLQAWRRWRLRRLGASVDGSCKIGPAVRVEHRGGRILVGPDCTLETGVILSDYGGSVALPRWVHVGPYTVIYGHGGVTIGEGTLIAMHCCILSSNHTVAPFGTVIRSQPDLLLPTVIGRDVWLCAGVTVLGGVTIGDGCVIGAGAVVTKNLPPGSIAYGSPAVIRSRRDGAPAD
jgi:acetyltransferase-like isoleucine patch superfamily enzyme